MELSKGDKQKADKVSLSWIVNTDDIQLPDFIETPNREWVNYGVNNLFPDELIELYNNSGAHNAIIESKVRMMGGEGIYQEGEYSERTEMFIDNPNKNESLDDIYSKLSLDFEIYGLAYIEIQWSKDKKSIAEIYHIDASKVRWGKLDERGNLTHFYYSRDWSNYRKEAFRPIEVPIFNDEKKDKRQILPIVRYSPGQSYYTMPDYVGSLKWINIDTEIANFHLNNLRNGMSPNIFFGFPEGELTGDERKTIVDGIRGDYKGTQARKDVVAFWSGDKEPIVKILETSDADKQYDLLNKTTLQQILIGHKVVNENLVGISTPGKLGSAGEVIANYELYYNTIIKPEQTKVLDMLNKIGLINGYNELAIQQLKPLDFEWSENIMKEILTQDELRELIGYEPLEETEIVEDDEPEVETEMVKVDLSDDDLYQWVLGGDKPCPACEGFAGQIKTMSEWKELAVPGQSGSFPHGSYGTFCEDKCKCELQKLI